MAPSEPMYKIAAIWTREYALGSLHPESLAVLMPEESRPWTELFQGYKCILRSITQAEEESVTAMLGEDYTWVLQHIDKADCAEQEENVPQEALRFVRRITKLAAKRYLANMHDDLASAGLPAEDPPEEIPLVYFIRASEEARRLYKDMNTDEDTLKRMGEIAESYAARSDSADTTEPPQHDIRPVVQFDGSLTTGIRYNAPADDLSTTQIDEAQRLHASVPLQLKPTTPALPTITEEQTLASASTLKGPFLPPPSESKGESKGAVGGTKPKVSKQLTAAEREKAEQEYLNRPLDEETIEEKRARRKLTTDMSVNERGKALNRYQYPQTRGGDDYSSRSQSPPEVTGPALEAVIIKFREQVDELSESTNNGFLHLQAQYKEQNRVIGLLQNAIDKLCARDAERETQMNALALENRELKQELVKVQTFLQKQHITPASIRRLPPPTIEKVIIPEEDPSITTPTQQKTKTPFPAAFGAQLEPVPQLNASILRFLGQDTPPVQQQHNMPTQAQASLNAALSKGIPEVSEPPPAPATTRTKSTGILGVSGEMTKYPVEKGIIYSALTTAYGEAQALRYVQRLHNAYTKRDPTAYDRAYKMATS